jgi:hypothetical protein
MKWIQNERKTTNDDQFDRDCISETDATAKNMKRDNLVYLFLTDTGVDRYVATHLFGLVKQKNALTNQTMTENSMIEQFDLDETLTH